MLEKSPGNYRVEIRAIALLDSGFNFNNKLMARDMSVHAQRDGLIAKEQYGSRKHKECSDQSLNKVLTTDLWRITKTTGIICSTDLKSCYDRIVHSVATLCSRRWGVPSNALQSAYGTLSRMRFHIAHNFE